MADTEFIVDKANLEVRTIRNFTATPKHLWQAYTEADQIPQWWGPDSLTTVIDKLEVKVGGSWRFVQTEPGGKEHAFHGEFREIDAPHKLVYSFEYEPIPGHVLIETITFEAQDDDTTLLTSIAKYENIDDLEGMVSMGMEAGDREDMDRLAILVETE